ncbi:MAG: hypothetical protein K6U04_01600 [Armatimonadetes bacterium]|nr:hypothetical protein [Armatimonadota bacterium]
MNHKPGPWKWFANTKSKEIHLATNYGGRHFIIEFARLGFQKAQPVFQDHDEGVMYKAFDRWLSEPDHKGDCTIIHPDARLIEMAPELYDCLKRIVKVTDDIFLDMLKVEILRAREVLEKVDNWGSV